MNSEKRIDGDKDGEERDFRHFRMQELDCVNSTSRIGSGERFSWHSSVCKTLIRKARKVPRTEEEKTNREKWAEGRK